MRGGKREGAGRKSSESTVRISVPIGVLNTVQGMIDAYKSGHLEKYLETTLIESQAINKLQKLNICQEINDSDAAVIQQITSNPSLEVIQEPCGALELNNCQEIKKDAVRDSQINLDLLFNHQEEIRNATRELERLSVSDRKVLKKSFGSLYKAAQMGVRAEGKNFSFPTEIRHKIKISENSRISY